MLKRLNVLQVGGRHFLRPSVVTGVNFPFERRIHSSDFLRNGNVFGELTQQPNTPAVEESREQAVDPADIVPANDKQLQQYYLEEAKKSQISTDKYFSPLKRNLFDANVKQHGFYKNHQIVQDGATGKRYKLSLTEEEIEALEPSIYLQSYRIKSSMKKATIVNRFVRGYSVKNAINQLHFNPKKMATELEKFLKKGLDQARELQYNEDGLYIHALWTGSDGSWRKRLDAKGRGRLGIIEHPYIHLKAILKTDLTTKRLAWEREHRNKNAKPRMFINDEPLNFSVRPYYKW